ncbi:MAG: bifunctional metallophosphatase/5'-nucleotidase [Bacteroidales bacterium]
MKRFKLSLFLFICFISFLSAKQKEVLVNILQTSDVHGAYFPYNFIEDKAMDGSLARMATLVKEQKSKYGNANVLVFDNGDFLQGQPTAYYYNFIDTVSIHLGAAALNYIGYNGMSIGNHDIETGHAVYDRFAKQVNFPVLGANVIDTKTNQPYFKPYEVYTVNGVKIAVLGMITPAIPAWLPETLWEGLRFEDMEETAKKWLPVIRSKENPDAIIGMFHAGQNESLMSDKYKDNASLSVAKAVPGFDVVFMGHDHQAENKKIVNVAGDSVLVINPANNGRYVANVDLKFMVNKGKVLSKRVSGTLTNMKNIKPDDAFMAQFKAQYDEVKEFVSKPIGVFEEEVDSRPSYFGSSAFIDLIHQLQLNITGADISITAPLSFRSEIKKGTVRVRDMFNLYKYENMLYVMNLSGKEVKGLLEESYDRWANTMQSPEDHLLLLKKDTRSGNERQVFANMSFNFDSGAGIIYTVDVTKPYGEKVQIISMADGQPFDQNKTYKVALNSYRGNGGGDLLTKGAGIPQNELKDRIIYSTDKDLRYYLMDYIEKQGTLNPQPLNQWKFIPEEWTVPAAKRDYKLIFGEDMN